MKKFIISVLLAFAVSAMSFAQFDVSMGSDFMIRRVNVGGNEVETVGTLMAVDLGGYIFINDSWYALYRPTSFSWGYLGSYDNSMFHLDLGLGFGARLVLSEEHSFRAGIAPVFTFEFAKFGTADATSLLFGGSLDLHYQYEPFSDEDVSFAFIAGTRLQFMPLRIFTTNANFDTKNMFKVNPYVGVCITFNTSIKNYNMTKPGF